MDQARRRCDTEALLCGCFVLRDLCGAAEPQPYHQGDIKFGVALHPVLSPLSLRRLWCLTGLELLHVMKPTRRSHTRPASGTGPSHASGMPKHDIHVRGPTKRPSGGCCGGGKEAGAAAPTPNSPASVVPESDPQGQEAAAFSPTMAGAPKDDIVGEDLPAVAPNAVVGDESGVGATDNPEGSTAAKPSTQATAEGSTAAASAATARTTVHLTRNVHVPSVGDDEAEDIEQDIIQGNRRPSNATTETFNTFITSFAPSGVEGCALR